MRAVIYSKDMEPITILELPLQMLEHLERYRHLNLPVYNNPDDEPPLLQDNQPEYLQIFCEKIVWPDGTTKPILLTNDDELALSLKPDWLPGQQQAVNWYKGAIRHLIEQIQNQHKKP